MNVIGPDNSQSKAENSRELNQKQTDAPLLNWAYKGCQDSFSNPKISLLYFKNRIKDGNNDLKFKIEFQAR